MGVFRGVLLEGGITGGPLYPQVYHRGRWRKILPFPLLLLTEGGEEKLVK